MRAQWQVFHIWLSRHNYKRWSSLLHQFFKFEISLWNILSWYLQIVSSQIYFPFGCNLKTANSTFMNLDKILFSYIYMGRISGCGQGSLKPWVPHRLRPANSPQKGSWPGSHQNLPENEAETVSKQEGSLEIRSCVVGRLAGGAEADRKWWERENPTRPTSRGIRFQPRVRECSYLSVQIPLFIN